MSPRKEGHKPFALTFPCDNCPFRNDISAYLSQARVRQIERSLRISTFPCHKTTKFDSRGRYHRSKEEIHCAGALILLEKLDRPSQMMRIAERLRLYDRSCLNMSAPVFNSFEKMVLAQLK